MRSVPADLCLAHGLATGHFTAFTACALSRVWLAKAMQKISYDGYRFPPEIIRQAIWLYLRFTLSLRDVEDLLAERGIVVSYETIRRWVNHFGPTIAAELRKRRPKPHASWHLDEMYLKIAGRMVYLWRFVPERMTTDKLASYAAAVRELGIESRHQTNRWANNRAENSHQPTRRRERKMQRFKSLDRLRDFSRHTPLSTTPSTSNAISHQGILTKSFAPKR
jgi:putative transposase